MIARVRSGTLQTYDYIEKRPQFVKDAWLDNMEYILEDVLTTTSQKVELL